jgi:hypothetical protein
VRRFVVWREQGSGNGTDSENRQTLAGTAATR